MITFGGEAVLNEVYKLTGGIRGAVADFDAVAAMLEWDVAEVKNVATELRDAGYLRVTFGGASLTAAGHAATA
ncbi:MAG TPA: hypothetical protein VF669_06290 [Tepidisphaeraceae bacterium]|jgi:Mn-dependent DtxR family transcriptional regulator